MPNRQHSWMRSKSNFIRRYAPQTNLNTTQDWEASTDRRIIHRRPHVRLCRRFCAGKGYFLTPQLTILPVRVITPSLAGGDLLPLQWHRRREGHTSADHSGSPFQNLSKAATQWHSLTLRIYLVWHNLSVHGGGAAGAPLLWFLREFFIFWNLTFLCRCHKSVVKKAFRNRVILLLNQYNRWISDIFQFHTVLSYNLILSMCSFDQT